MHHFTTEKIYPVLPLVYALVATCFWVLMIGTGRINFVWEKIASDVPSFLVMIYSFSCLLFWLPAFRKNIYFSLVHSLPLFLLPPLNMLLRTFRHKIVAHDYIINLLRIYAAGFLLYTIAIIFLLFIRWLFLSVISFGHQKIKSIL